MTDDLIAVAAERLLDLHVDHRPPVHDPDEPLTATDYDRQAHHQAAIEADRRITWETFGRP